MKRSSVVLVVLGLAAAYLATAWLGLQVAAPPGNATALWPPSGIGLAALLVWGRRAWPGIFLGSLAVNVAFFPTEHFATDLAGAAAIATGSTVALVLAATLLAPRGGRAVFSTPRGVVSFAGVVALAGTVSATAGLAATASFGAVPASSAPLFWVTWWLGDTVGMWVVTPLVTLLDATRRPPRRAEAVALTLTTLVTTQLVFGRPLPWPDGTALPLAWLPLVSLMWAGVRFRAPMVASQTLLLHAMVSWATLGGRGPFAALPQATGLLLVDGLLVTLVLTGLLLAAAEVREAGVRAGLEAEVRERTATLEAAHRALTAGIEERARLDAQLMAVDKQEALGRLAGGVAHDFNNLLTVITGAASEVADQAADPATQDAARAILAASHRAAELTRHLLAVARRQPSKVRRVDVAVLLAEVRALLRPLLPENVRLDVGGDAAVVAIDATQLEQVVLNLAINARDAMPRGGRLRITTAARTLDDAAAAALGLAPGPWVSLEVADDGEGISDEVKARIFEPFFTTKPAERGTGLGLSTALGIATQAGGALRVESAPGHGATFTLWLPRARGDVQPEVADAGPKRAVRSGATVLVVDDEPLVRRTVGRVLERAGYRVLVAADGEEGLAVARLHRAELDVVLTDVVMPRMGGPQLAQALRAEGPVRVVFMSGYHERQAELANERLVPKPFSPEQLESAIAEALAQPPPEAADTTRPSARA